MIKIDNVTKRYRDSDTLSLDNISLDIPDGSIVGLIGVNGAGKSTLLRIAAGIYKQDGGAVLIDGDPVYENTKAKAKIAYISDEQYYRPASSMKKMASVYNYLREGFSMKKFYALAEDFGLNVNKSLSSFSKGMRRQNDVITALSCEAKYILCDETFDGLDPITREKTKRIFIENVADEGATILLASHNLKELEDICDKIVLLDNGRLVFSAELDDLKDSVNKYQVMFRNNNFPLDIVDPVRPVLLKQSGQIISFIAAGNEEFVRKSLEAAARDKGNELAYMEALPLSLDEIFSYKLKETGMSGLSGMSEALGCEASCETAPEEKREKQGGEI
jgi:ABC-2 type transport system ATP-binding protein